MAQLVSVEIDSIAAGGDGVGRSNGLVVFVPRTAPGELVTARISGKGSFARGSLRAIARPSENRIEPPCTHYSRDRCGGCQVQHLAYSAQLRAKRRIIRDAIERIGNRQAEVRDVTPSESEWRYRTRLTLAMRRSPTGEWIAGLHPYDDPAKVFPLSDCLITDKRIVAAWREILSQSRLFPGAAELRGNVRMTADGPVFVMMGAMRWTSSPAFFDAVPSLAACWWENDEGARRTIGDRRPPRTLQRPSASFEQVNAEVAMKLRRHVIAIVSGYAPEKIVDAYSGSGDTAIELARGGARVTAIELDSDAARWCALHLPEGSVSIRGRVEEALPRALPADAVVLNPPRAGADKAVTEVLQHTPVKPRVIAYVSCNPATLARDISRLPGYRIASLTPFDMFPQTAHVETVCELVPEAA